MELETTLAKNIDTANKKAKYDAACKRLLSEKIILAWILKACVEEYRDYEVEEIAEKYIEGTPQVAEISVAPDSTNVASMVQGIGTEDTTMTEGKIFYDIRFVAVVPASKELIRLIINVEAQNKFNPGYPLIKRALYYCSRMISSQSETEFSNSHYEQIKKVYSIWVCTTPSEEWKNTITKYSMTETNIVGHAKEKKQNYDLMTAVMICLGDANDENYGGILELLDTLLSGKLEPVEKKKILEENFKIKMTQTLESEVDLMCNLSDGVWERGLEAGRKVGMEIGLEAGRKAGMEAGVEAGKKEAILFAIKNLMETMKLTMEQAMSALNIEESEQSEYIEKIKMMK